MNPQTEPIKLNRLERLKKVGKNNVFIFFERGITYLHHLHHLHCFMDRKPVHKAVWGSTCWRGKMYIIAHHVITIFYIQRYNVVKANAWL